jgi:transcriptional regulator with XRE-family HTH domain
MVNLLPTRSIAEAGSKWQRIFQSCAEVETRFPPVREVPVARSEAFGELVRELVNGLPNRKVADLADISHTTVGDMKAGRIPSRDTLLKLAGGLQLNPDQRARLFELAGYRDVPAHPGLDPNEELVQLIVERAAELAQQRIRQALEIERARWARALQSYMEGYKAYEQECRERGLPAQPPDFIRFAAPRVRDCSWAPNDQWEMYAENELRSVIRIHKEWSVRTLPKAEQEKHARWVRERVIVPSLHDCDGKNGNASS